MTACISESTRVPAAATVALLIAVGVCVRDVKLTLSFSTFTVPAYIGLAACILLVFFEGWENWLAVLGKVL